MAKYNFDKMGGIWADEAQKITENGIFIAHSGNWDLWADDTAVYSIPVSGSGAGASVWCGLSSFHSRLYRLRQVRGYSALIPADWKNVNFDFLSACGIA